MDTRGRKDSYSGLASTWSRNAHARWPGDHGPEPETSDPGPPEPGPAAEKAPGGAGGAAAATDGPAAGSSFLLTSQGDTGYRSRGDVLENMYLYDVNNIAFVNCFLLS